MSIEFGILNSVATIQRKRKTYSWLLQKPTQEMYEYHNYILYDFTLNILLLLITLSALKYYRNVLKIKIQEIKNFHLRVILVYESY